MVLPWLCFFTFFICLFVMVNDPSIIQPTSGRFYCHLASQLQIPATINIVTVIIVAAINFPLQFYMAFILYRNWDAFRHLSTDNSGVSLSMYIRLMCFTLVGGMAFGLSAVLVPTLNVMSTPRNWSVLLTIVPSVGAIAFGTQKDIFDTFAFWRKRVTPMLPEPSSEYKVSRFVISSV